MRVSKWVSLAAAAAVFGGMAGGVKAAYFTDWSAGDVIRKTDPVDGALDDSQDATNIMYRFHAGVHYFRQDLRGAPNDGPGQSGPDYMVEIDAVPGGASSGDGSTNSTLSYYVAQGLTGIDEIVDAHWVQQNPVNNHAHVYSAGSLPPYNFTLEVLQTAGGSYQHTQNGGKTLEWAIPMAVLPYWPRTFYISCKSINRGQTHDVAGPIKVPPYTRITQMNLDTNVWLKVTGTNSWVPKPVTATNLADPTAWSPIPSFGSTYPALSDGTYRVWFQAPTNTPPTRRFYRVVITNANP